MPVELKYTCFQHKSLPIFLLAALTVLRFVQSFYIRSNFFNILNPFPKYFTTVVKDHRLALLKYIKNYGEQKVPFLTDDMYCIEPFKSIIFHLIVHSVIALCNITHYISNSSHHSYIKHESVTFVCLCGSMIGN